MDWHTLEVMTFYRSLLNHFTGQSKQCKDGGRYSNAKNFLEGSLPTLKIKVKSFPGASVPVHPPKGCHVQNDLWFLSTLLGEHKMSCQFF